MLFRSSQDPNARRSPSTPSGACPPRFRNLVLGLVAVHLLAVLAEPLAFFSRSEYQMGPEFFALRRFLAPYVEWMYLDHGYFFFAPNPGPNHLVAVYRGQPSAEREEKKDFDLVFPNRNEEWPRLRYHRSFMLSEFYTNSFAPTALTPEELSDPPLVERWGMDRKFYESLQRSISRSIAQRLRKPEGNPDDPMNLVRLERPLPPPEETQEPGFRLNDSRRLRVLREGPDPVPSPLREPLNRSDTP